MKKITSIFAIALYAVCTYATNPTITTEWELSSARASNPTYIGTSNNCRGMALGTFESNKVLAIVSRQDANTVKIIDASTGSEISSLITTGISGGAIVMNDAGITSDGKVLVSNVANSVGSIFKIYCWKNSTDAPTVTISYTLTEAHRFGDNITVTGSMADGTAKVYAASSALVSGIAKIFCWSMISDGNGGYVFNSANPTTLSSAQTVASSLPSICFLPDGKFLYKGNGIQIKSFNADGTATGDASSSSVVASGGNSIKYLTTVQDTTYAVYFRYGASLEKGDIIKIVNGSLANATSVAKTPSLGTNANGNGTGRIATDVTDNGLYVYVLGTNNGIGKYKVAWTEIPTKIEMNNNSEIGISVKKNIILVSGTNFSSIELYNSIGQKINYITNKNEMVINNLHGIYIVKVKVDGKVIKTSKISI